MFFSQLWEDIVVIGDFSPKRWQLFCDKNVIKLHYDKTLSLLSIYVEETTNGLRFASGSSNYEKLVDSSTHDFNYWEQKCTGILSISTSTMGF